MSEPATLQASRLAIAALALGIASLLLQVAGMIWSSATPAEAGLVVIWLASIPTALIAAAGAVTGIVALVRRVRPRWMGVVGLVLSAIPFLNSLLNLVLLWVFWVQLPDLYTY